MIAWARMTDGTSVVNKEGKLVLRRYNPQCLDTAIAPHAYYSTALAGDGRRQQTLDQHLNRLADVPWIHLESMGR